MSIDHLYVEKELSWLSFNERVLQEAADKSVPIVERVRFLGIFSNNLDEFFRVRVADVKRRLLISKVSKGDANPTQHLLTKIQTKVLKLQEDFDLIYTDVIKGLARHNIFLINEDQLSEQQGLWLKQYFRDKLLRYIAPIIVDRRTDLAKILKDDLTYLIAEMRSPEQVKYAVIEIPTDDAPRFVQMPREKGKKRKNVILLDNIIRYCLDQIFAPFFQYETCHAYSMKMTRDAEYGLSDDIDQSLMEQMSEGLKQRLTAEPVRFVHDREMPESMVELIKFKLGISNFDSVIPGGRYHNFRDFIGFPNIGRSYLEHQKLPAVNSHDFDSHITAFDAIKAKDILLYYPYHKFRYVTEFLRQAAIDPAVRDIKLSVYRLAKRSRIVKSLIDAAENGKKVTVIVELKARFDEEANIEWAKALTEAGVKVDFGVPSLKCHSKLCLVTRKEGDELVRYAHIGTGNFHEKTAKIYTDFSLFTRNREITEEVKNVFEFIIHSYKRFNFKHLVVSPTDSRSRIYRAIDREISSASRGLKASIFLKINNVDDKGIIDRLYKASSAGVKVRMIVRGMCALIPGIPNLSENIEIISIVDRFLEHPRVAVFENEGEPAVWISSADWMTRNIDRRVEVGCPIYDPALKQQIIDILNIQWSDTTKARIIDKEQSNQYKPRGNRRKIRSQIATYEYLKAVEQNKASA
ncbi:polyphosphate kinase 1 [Corallincola spongiicola]|uniref:Polyphosphate kinase n=1 Tax=Corallincola spongiicola TaxID=2520508 RepID=A0ABY1WSN9_9GAMM|nr:polyphosphate kinase 1 [Corallincola spongiicola]TAA47593.1 polyphosphate kinase 1 [Corallincola spongiicola]